jgi:hypothetical protein
MKTKTWKVITNTGKQADLESGLETKTFFVHRKRVRATDLDIQTIIQRRSGKERENL